MRKLSHPMIASHFHTFSFKLRVGNPNLSSEEGDIIEVLSATTHPADAYFDVAVLETRPLNFTAVSFTVSSLWARPIFEWTSTNLKLGLIAAKLLPNS